MRSRKPSRTRPWAGALFAFFFGGLLTWYGIHANRTYWLLSHHGQRTWGTLEHVTRTTHRVNFIPTGSTYSFDVSYPDTNGNVHRLHSEASEDLVKKHRSTETTFTHHPIEVLFVPEHPEVAGLPEMIEISVFPLFFGIVLMLISIWRLGPWRLVDRQQVMIETPMVNSLTKNMLAVEAHIRKIAPEWNRFRKERAGFDQVTFFAYSGEDGMFGARGYVATKEHLLSLRNFMQGTGPPRHVFVGSVATVGAESLDSQRR